jgi:hypothetical protein
MGPFPASWLLKGDVSNDVKTLLNALTNVDPSTIKDNTLLTDLIPTIDAGFWGSVNAAFANFHLTLTDKDEQGVTKFSDLVNMLSLKIHQKYSMVAMLSAFPPDVTPDPTFITGKRAVATDVTSDAIMNAIAARLLLQVQKALPGLGLTALFLVPTTTIRTTWTWGKVQATVISDVQQFEGV